MRHSRTLRPTAPPTAARSLLQSLCLSLPSSSQALVFICTSSGMYHSPNTLYFYCILYVFGLMKKQGVGFLCPRWSLVLEVLETWICLHVSRDAAEWNTFETPVDRPSGTTTSSACFTAHTFLSLHMRHQSMMKYCLHCITHQAFKWEPIGSNSEVTALMNSYKI